jgi:hypothetical protein
MCRLGDAGLSTRELDCAYVDVGWQMPGPVTENGGPASRVREAEESEEGVVDRVGSNEPRFPSLDDSSCSGALANGGDKLFATLGIQLLQPVSQLLMG